MAELFTLLTRRTAGPLLGDLTLQTCCGKGNELLTPKCDGLGDEGAASVKKLARAKPISSEVRGRYFMLAEKSMKLSGFVNAQ